MRIIAITLAVLFINFLASPAQDIFANNPDEIVGIWMVPEKDAKVEVYKGDDDKYHGKIVWLLEPHDENGKPRKDIHNKDHEMAKQPLIGLNVVTEFDFNLPDGKWDNGEVYNSRNGKTYAGFIKMQEDGTLFLRGHVKGLKFLGKTNIWERTSL